MSDNPRHLPAGDAAHALREIWATMESSKPTAGDGGYYVGLVGAGCDWVPMPGGDELDEGDEESSDGE